MSGHDAFERILTSLHEAMLDDVHWPTTTALIDEACGLTSNALLVGEGRWCAVTSVRRGPGHRDGRRGMIST